MFRHARRLTPYLSLVVVVLRASASAGAPSDGDPNGAKPTRRNDLVQAVRQAFLDTHDGWSTDEVLLQDDLNRRFLRRCTDTLPDVEAAQLNRTLLNLRKAGQLGPVVTRSRRDRHDAYQHAAEIAARVMYDKYQLTIDRVFCDPAHRRMFDWIAHQIAPDVSPYLLRKAAFGLRKQRRLRPELVLRVADWDRTVKSIPAQRILADPTVVPDQPGVYIFRDRSGYLYVGQSVNLRVRLAQHLDDSDRQSLANYLKTRGVMGDLVVDVHAFASHSPAQRTTVRRAYESELIRSRRPRFNVQP